MDLSESRAVRAPRRLSNHIAFIGVAAILSTFFIAAGAPTPLLLLYEASWRFDPWVVTLAFGVYAFGLLGALLVVGSLSDYVGRRPLLVGALALEAGSMLVFLVAPSIEWVITARILQGIATGAATSAFSAAILELAPESRRWLGPVINSAVPAVGLGLGALLAGAVAQFDSHAAFAIWSTLLVTMLAATGFAAFVPETVTRQHGALRSLIPRVSVPLAARRHFVVAVPLQIAAWMMAALFMGLMPTVLASAFGHHGPLEIGATSFIEPAAAGVAAIATSKLAPGRVLTLGGICVMAGALLVVSGIALAILPLLWIGGVVGGIGFGTTFAGTVRTLSPTARPHERAGLFAAIYVVAYLAFGAPAIIAGVFIASAGVITIATVFGVAIAVSASLGLVGQLRLRRPARVVEE